MLESIHQNLEDMRLKTIVENICQKGALKHLDSPSSSSHNAHPLNNPMGLQKTKCLSHHADHAAHGHVQGTRLEVGFFWGPQGFNPLSLRPPSQACVEVTQVWGLVRGAKMWEMCQSGSRKTRVNDGGVQEVTRLVSLCKTCEGLLVSSHGKGKWVALET